MCVSPPLQGRREPPQAEDATAIRLRSLTMSLTARISATFCAASNDSSFTLNSVFSAAAGLASWERGRVHQPEAARASNVS